MGWRTRLIAIAAAVAMLGATGGAAAQVTTRSLQSRALAGRLHYIVELPKGYATSRLRYPVVYFLHGLPASATAYQALGWVESALRATGRKAILVLPQGAGTGSNDPEYHNWGAGQNWETALAGELPKYIDAHYRTIANRSGRAIVGLSAGGYGAAIIGLHHPREYSVIESWSGYFRPTDPTGTKTLDVGSKTDNDYASVHVLVSRLKTQFRRSPTFFGFYVGKSDPTFVADNTRLDRELSAAGVSHLFTVYAGGHTRALWQARAVRWLALALAHLHAPTAEYF